MKNEPGEEVSNKAHGVKHKAGKWRGSYVLQCKRLEGWRYLRVLDTRTLLTDSKIKRMNMEGGLLTRLWDVHISIPIGLFHKNYLQNLFTELFTASHSQAGSLGISFVDEKNFR